MNKRGLVASMSYDTLLKKLEKDKKRKAKEYDNLIKDTPKKIQKQVIKKKVINKIVFDLFYDTPKNI